MDNFPHKFQEVFAWSAPSENMAGTFYTYENDTCFAYRKGKEHFSKGHIVDRYANIEQIAMFIESKASSAIMPVICKARYKQIGREDITIAYRIGKYVVKYHDEQKTVGGLHVVFLNVPPVKRRYSVFKKQCARTAEKVRSYIGLDIIILSAMPASSTHHETIGVKK